MTDNNIQQSDWRNWTSGNDTFDRVFKEAKLTIEAQAKEIERLKKELREVKDQLDETDYRLWESESYLSTQGE